MSHRRAAAYFNIVGALGTALFFAGTIWLGLLIYSRRNYAEAVKYEFTAPWTLRLMVFFGLALLLIFGVRITLRWLRKRSY